MTGSMTWLSLAGLATALVCAGADVRAAELVATTDASGHAVVSNIGRSSGPTRSVRPRRDGAARRAARARYAPLVRAAAQRYSLPTRLIEAVIAVESDFDPQALSRAGAQGLMQLMPETARELGVRDPWDPAENIDGGAFYLRQLLDRFGQNRTLAIAAYNAGPTAVERAGRVPRIPETERYVRKVRAELGIGSLVHGTSRLRSVEGTGGRVVTNIGYTQSSLRVIRDQGRITLTNR